MDGEIEYCRHTLNVLLFGCGMTQASVLSQRGDNQLKELEKIPNASAWMTEFWSSFDGSPYTPTRTVNVFIIGVPGALIRTSKRVLLEFY